MNGSVLNGTFSDNFAELVFQSFCQISLHSAAHFEDSAKRQKMEEEINSLKHPLALFWVFRIGAWNIKNHMKMANKSLVWRMCNWIERYLQKNTSFVNEERTRAIAWPCILLKPQKLDLVKGIYVNGVHRLIHWC